LLEQVVTTTAEVLEAQAGSLYLINEDTGKLEIQAAAGYHKPLLEKKTTYDMGEGTTGWIAQTGKTFKADSYEELHSKSPWRGKYKELIGGRDAVAFLGIPLKIIDRFSHQERVIGVLKLEDRNDPKAIYTQEDVRLGEMMANIIATVVYNTQVSSTQLQKLSNNLKRLSIALVGGREMRDLVDQVVETTAQVLGAEASSLYLIDEITNQLVIQAATGYQKSLVAHRATYALGEGVTGCIADKGERFRANSTDELRSHPNWKGKYRLGVADRIARSFLGLPLKVVDRFTEKEKVIGVL
jgi:signal transduction protein with GAF and PtsI domain